MPVSPPACRTAAASLPKGTASSLIARCWGDLVRGIIVASFPNAIRLDAAVAASDPAIRERRSQLLRQVVEHRDQGI